MKKTTTLMLAGVIAAVLSIGSADAAPLHNNGHHHAPQQHTVTQVQSVSHQGHNHIAHNGGHHHVQPHHPHHHRPHHHNSGASTGDLIIATAILISAII
ncbi:MAG: hypothetical protein J5742_04070 [Alphaproteobacteria bacterium]|nr:hypothetical protein [Alphaproteobacteria bacterium]